MVRTETHALPVCCPGQGSCNKTTIISHETAEAALKPLPEKLAKYCEVRALKENPNARLCPRPRCRHINTTGSDDHPDLVCESCSLHFCFHHETAHAGRSCAEMSRSWRVELWKRIHTKKCPKCGAAIQKNGGCPKMECFKCKHKFCWTCLGSTENGRHVSRVFPPLSCLNVACSTPRIWAMRVTVGVPVALVLSPVILCYSAYAAAHGVVGWVKNVRAKRAVQRHKRVMRH